MSRRVYKNYQVNIGAPFEIKTPINFRDIISVEEDMNDEALNNEELNDEMENTPEAVLERAQKQADTLVREAELEARKIIDQTKKETEKQRNSVLEEARNSGYETGYNEGKKQYEDLIREAQSVLEDTRAKCRDTIDGMESDIVEMIIDIAKKVIGMELETNKDVVITLAKEAFDRCINKEGMVLRVSSDDYDYVVQNKEKILSAVNGVEDFDIRKESAMRAGSCIVETQFGNIDTGVQTKIGKIEDAFMQVAGK